MSSRSESSAKKNEYKYIISAHGGIITSNKGTKYMAIKIPTNVEIFTYSKLGIPKELIRSEHARGIYFSPLYDNTYDFLCGKCDGNDLKKSFETSTESLSNTWKEKHARGRIGFLKKKNKVSTETLFYDDLIYLSWQETKDKYLSQVGR